MRLLSQFGDNVFHIIPILSQEQPIELRGEVLYRAHSTPNTDQNESTPSAFRQPPWSVPRWADPSRYHMTERLA